MEKDRIVMSKEENGRCQLLAQVCMGEKTLMEACKEMQLGYRQAKRLKAAYLKEDPAGVVHGNRGRLPANKISDNDRARIVALSHEKYSQFNDVHFSEMLVEREGLSVSRETVRIVRRLAEIEPKHKRRAKGHRARRAPKECFGDMVLWDGSHHNWFGPQSPKCCLMAAVDDATSQLVAARFEHSETSAAYLRLLDSLVDLRGVPGAIYHDRHSALVRNDDHWCLQEQMQGRQFPTQIGAVLEQLGVVSIPAHSAQAKGRVERAFETFQDRLIAEMQLEGITDIGQANQWLERVFIQRHNKRMGKAPKKPENLFRPLPPSQRKAILSFKYSAVVYNDNTVRLAKRVFDIPPGPSRRSYAKARVEVRQHVDGSWSILYKNQTIADYPPTTLVSPIKAYSTCRTKGAREWLWIPQQEAADD